MKTLDKYRKTVAEGKGKRVKDIGRLVELAQEGRSVLITYGPRFSPQCAPATWVWNWQGHVLWRVIEAGYLFEYIPKSKRGK